MMLKLATWRLLNHATLSLLMGLSSTTSPLSEVWDLHCLQHLSQQSWAMLDKSRKWHLNWGILLWVLVALSITYATYCHALRNHHTIPWSAHSQNLLRANHGQITKLHHTYEICSICYLMKWQTFRRLDGSAAIQPRRMRIVNILLKTRGTRPSATLSSFTEKWSHSFAAVQEDGQETKTERKSEFGCFFLLLLLLFLLLLLLLLLFKYGGLFGWRRE